MPIGLDSVKRLATAFNNLGTGSTHDPLNKTGELNGREVRQANVRGCYLECVDSQTAREVYSYAAAQTNYFYNRQVVLDQNYDPVWATQIPYRGGYYLIVPGVCPAGTGALYPVSSFARFICPTFGQGANSGFGCVNPVRTCDEVATASTYISSRPTQGTGTTTGIPTAAAASTAALGALAVIPAVGGLVALGIGAYCIYKYLTKRSSDRYLVTEEQVAADKTSYDLEMANVDERAVLPDLRTEDYRGDIDNMSSTSEPDYQEDEIDKRENAKCQSEQ